MVSDMKDLLIQGILALSSFVASYFILRLIFKKSIVFQAGYLLVCFAIFVFFMAFWEAKLGINSAFWILPVVYVVGISILLFVNKILRLPLEKSILQVKNISQGDLNQNIDHSNSKNELGILNNSIRELSYNLKRIIGEIASNTDNLVSASQQTSSSSQQLSQGANEQASSIEEISSTIEEITTNIQQNTENALQSEKASAEANKSFQEVASKANEANEANKIIANKITVITDIAFQTNLLALNAAVEAARAGEYGRGFAVVASEVRKLAENSKIAAEQIISMSKTSVEKGMSAGQLMMNTIPKIDKTLTLAQEISAASQEQNSGIGQVNNAIQQLNSVTQQNASASEELASTAEQLASQAEQLKDLISFFNIGKSEKNTVSQVYSSKLVKDVEKKTTRSVKGANLLITDYKDRDFEAF